MKIKDKNVKNVLRDVDKMLRDLVLTRKMDSKDLYALKCQGKIQALIELIDWEEE